MKARDRVGVVGYAGDLGSQLVAPLADAYRQIIGYDLSTVEGDSRIIVASKLEDLLSKSSIVHWCAPLESIKTIPSSAILDLFILHDSVMSNSLKAAKILKRRSPAINSIAIVHFLMNDKRKVVVSADSDDSETINAHLEAIGFDPKIMETTEHDRLMAHS